MPIGIIISGKAIPTILEEATESALLSKIIHLKISPALTTIEEAKEWLNSLPQPSGWYASRDAAKAAAQRAARSKKVPPLEKVDIAELVKETRAILGLSRVEFGRKLGFNGNQNTVNKTIYELENRKGSLRAEKLEILNGIRSEIELDEPGSFVEAVAVPPSQERVMA